MQQEFVPMTNLDIKRYFEMNFHDDAKALRVDAIKQSSLLMLFASTLFDVCNAFTKIVPHPTDTQRQLLLDAMASINIVMEIADEVGIPDMKLSTLKFGNN